MIKRDLGHIVDLMFSLKGKAVAAELLVSAGKISKEKANELGNYFLKNDLYEAGLKMFQYVDGKEGFYSICDVMLGKQLSDEKTSVLKEEDSLDDERMITDPRFTLGIFESKGKFDVASDYAKTLGNKELSSAYRTLDRILKKQ